MVYMLHWFVVIPWVMLKMALLPKTLVWQKTVHQGASPLPASAFSEFTPSQALDLEDDVIPSPEG
jgi:1,2-diacylglycerol 3-beta-glucosyltransferase